MNNIQVRFVGDQLELNDAAVAKIRRKKFSFSAAKAQHGCRARFGFEKILPFSAGPLEPAGLGSATHSVFEHVMGLPGKARTQKKAKELIRDYANTHIADQSLPASDYETFRTSVEAMTLPLWKIIPVAKVKTLGTELKIDTTVEGMPFLGFIDLLQSGSSGAVISDYKTGKLPNLSFGDDHGDQLRLYSALASTVTSEDIDHGELYYVAPDIPPESRLRIIERDEAEEARVVALVVDAWHTHQADMEDHTLPATTGPLCSWCPAVNECPLAHAAGITPDERFMRLATADQLCLTPHPTATPVSVSVSVPIADPEPLPIPEGKLFSEARPWEETGAYVNGSAYSTGGLFGYVELAAHIYHEATITPTPTDIVDMARMFQWLVAGVQGSISTTTDPNAGISTRLRGLLRTIIETSPPPLDRDRTAWHAWSHQTVKALKYYASAVYLMATTTPSPILITQKG